MPADFLHIEKLKKLWKQSVLQAIPRLREFEEEPNFFFEGHLINDWGLDSLEIYRLAADFHSLFQMMDHRKALYLNAKEPADLWLEHIFEAANDEQRDVHFRTSGSQAKPKIALHSKLDIQKEALYWSQKLTRPDRLYAMTSPLHIYGFIWSLILPQYWDLEPEFIAPDQWILDKPAMVISFPLALELALTQGADFKGLDIISSTAPISPNLRQQLGNEEYLHLLEVYGSSETGGLGYRYFPNEAYQGLEFRKIKDFQVQNSQGLSISIPDHLEWQDGNSFKLIGRKDGAVQIAGKQVYLQEIKSRIQEHPQIIEAYLRVEGNALKAWLQVSDSDLNEPFQRDLYTWLHNQLSPEQKPQYVHFSSAKPINQWGKEMDWSLN